MWAPQRREIRNYFLSPFLCLTWNFKFLAQILLWAFIFSFSLWHEIQTVVGILKEVIFITRPWQRNRFCTSSTPIKLPAGVQKSVIFHDQKNPVQNMFVVCISSNGNVSLSVLLIKYWAAASYNILLQVMFICLLITVSPYIFILIEEALTKLISKIQFKE